MTNKTNGHSELPFDAARSIDEKIQILLGEVGDIANRLEDLYDLLRETLDNLSTENGMDPRDLFDVENGYDF